MPTSAFLSFLVFCVVNTFAPGPGNILGLNVATTHGLRRGMPLFLGIFVSYFIVRELCGVLIFALGSLAPEALNVIKYIGVAYIAWLAFRVATSKPPQADDSEKSASFLEGFLLQFVNVKIYMVSITALTGFVTPYYTDLWTLLGFELIVATIGCAATATWIGAGLLLQRFYLEHFRAVNIVLALALVNCIISILM